MFCEHYLSKDKPTRFMICLKERNLTYKGKHRYRLDIAMAFPMPHESILIICEDGKETEGRYTAVLITLPDHDHKFYRVVVNGFGIRPMMLLTSCPVNIRKKQNIWETVEFYLTRWKGEESSRYRKQYYNLDDPRMRSHISVRNIAVRSLAVSYFAAAYDGRNIKFKLTERVFLVSRRFFLLPSFFINAIADGIFNLLFPDKRVFRGVFSAGVDELQPCFYFGYKLGKLQS